MVGDYMTESILQFVRVAVGLEMTDTSFDQELIVYTNSALGTLTQQGAGKRDTYIKDDTTKWSDYLPQNQFNSPILSLVQEYTVLQIRIMFDPPPQGTQKYMEEKIRENEWRIQTEVEILEKEDSND